MNGTRLAISLCVVLFIAGFQVDHSEAFGPHDSDRRNIVKKEHKREVRKSITLTTASDIERLSQLEMYLYILKTFFCIILKMEPVLTILFFVFPQFIRLTREMCAAARNLNFDRMPDEDGREN